MGVHYLRSKVWCWGKFVCFGFGRRLGRLPESLTSIFKVYWESIWEYVVIMSGEWYSL